MKKPILLASLALFPAASRANPADIFDCKTADGRIQVSFVTDFDGESPAQIRVSANGAETPADHWTQFKNYEGQVFLQFFTPTKGDVEHGYFLDVRCSGGRCSGSLTPFHRDGEPGPAVKEKELGISCSDE